ncbi:lipid II:glycine glycyltransferase FemX [Falsarthrobacter nasiphocae]|uniref:lipid II:glycine glycyltransferase FemX n=1 Tax=Falsarthrobacter nasiphocae TaxID=189863 RepID=UPI0031D3A399
MSASEHESTIAALPVELHVPFEQSAAWAGVDIANGARSHYAFLHFKREGELVAFASVDRYVRRTRESLVVMAGPVFTVERTPALEKAVVEALAEHARQDPTINPMYLRVFLDYPDAVPGTVRSIERGLYEREVVVELGKSPEALKKSFSSTARTRINRAARAGVEVREITENRGEVFRTECFPIMEETASRDAFSLLPAAHYVSVLEDAPEYSRLYVAYAPASDDAPEAAEKIPVAWMLTTEYHGRGCYLYGASNHRAQETSAMFALMHTILLRLTETGNREVGLTGITSERFPELKGVENFKLRFSKRIDELPRLFDVPLQPLKYRALRAALLTRSQGPALARDAVSRAKDLAGKARAAVTRPKAGAAQESIAKN